MNLINKIIRWLRENIFNYYDYCYASKKNEGTATMGYCRGLSGGDDDTEYLSYSCIDCPHLKL